MARIQAFVSASTVDLDYPHREGNGWIDWGWSSTLLHENRDDVDPLVDIDETDSETLADEIPDAIGEVLGAYCNNGSGTFYGEDSENRDGVSYTYAVHFKRIDGYHETLWCPVEDGNLEL